MVYYEILQPTIERPRLTKFEVRENKMLHEKLLSKMKETKESWLYLNERTPFSYSKNTGVFLSCDCTTEILCTQHTFKNRKTQMHIILRLF